MYARLLALEARDHDASLGLLRRATEAAPDPDIAALISLTLLRLERFDDARHKLEEALREYCVLPGGLLFQIASKVAQHPQIGASGWLGRGPDLELVGELSAAETSSALDISIDGQPAFSQLLRAHDGARRTFNVPCPPTSLHALLAASTRGTVLLGSGSRIPADFALDGRAAIEGPQLTGWARLGWQPTRVLRVQIEDEKGHRSAAKTGQLVLPVRRWPFWLNVRAARIRGDQLWISVQLPDGGWQPLPDTPLVLERALRPAGVKAQRLSEWCPSPSRRRKPASRAAKTDIIIPVYRGRAETLACITSVCETLDDQSAIVVVDDASDDPMLAMALGALAAEGRLTLLRNPENLGFVKSVNRALALNPTHDVIVLNSDTLVCGDWLSRLRASAYSGDAVGTVTPLCNNGSIASYPQARGTALAPEDAAGLHAFATATNPGVSVEIPVGVGFCLYMRRDCLKDVGFLDARTFGKGYGEETDFCLRARFRGWSHRLAADVFVYHAEGLSFGRRRLALLERSNRLVNFRYPGYDAFIANFQAQDPLRSVRHRLDEHRLSTFQGGFVLIVTLAMTGGVERFVAERCAAVRAQGLFPLVLKPAAAGDRSRIELWTDALDVPNLRYEIPKDLKALSLLLRALRIDAVEVQHFLHLDARVIELVRSLDAPYDVFVHDYSWICPRITLIDGSGQYCGEPAVTVCQKCVRRNGSHIGETISVPALRARSTMWLTGARRVLAPSNDTARRFERHISGLTVEVQPHTDDAAITVPVRAPAAFSQRKILRVALIGAIGDHKGYQVLLDCARNARARHLPLEFVVIGYTRDNDQLVATGKVFVTGRYSDNEAPHLLRREHPDVAWLPSVWPETWCYALDYALGSGLPILAFDLGAIADRVRAAGAGRLVPLGLKPGQINDQLLELGGASRPSREGSSRSVQSRLAHAHNDANMMSKQSVDVPMNKTTTTKTANEPNVDSLSASIQVLPLPAGLYLFSVKSAAPAQSKPNGPLVLPAVHVGLGPGVRSQDVEFIAGPNTHGAWLFSKGDLLVTKVNGTGATLVMTSVRAPGGEVLSIKVEKLEDRADAAPNTGVNRSAVEPEQPASRAPVDDQIVPLHIAAHIRARGDMTFSDVPWAGRVAPGLWVESFSIRPLHRLGKSDIEYKGLTGSGFETPWLTDEKMCGTKGMAVPLVGFAVRLKPSPATAGYDCEYSGYFQSGATVGPLRNGAPCRSTVANDPLEGIQVRLLKRAFTSASSEPESDGDDKTGAKARRARTVGRPPPRRP
jgi:GT2 family glycosyltransferase